MKKPNITPGPWKPSRHAQHRIEGANERQVAVTSGYSDTRNHEAVEAENEATNKAFSALPSILEALELLYCGCERAQQQGLNQPQVNGGMVLAKAALEKAGYQF